MFGTEMLGLRAGETNEDQAFEDEDLIWELTQSELGGDWPTPSPHELVPRLKVESMVVSHLQARMYETIATIAGLEGFDPEGLPAEVTVALHLTRAAGDAEYGLALLLERFPEVRDRLSHGSIDLRRARVIVECLAGVDDDLAQPILQKVLPAVSDLTTGQLRARIQRLKLTADPGQTRKDFLAGLDRRRITVEANPDGTANLLALNLEPSTVMAIRNRINHRARETRSRADTRTHDQLRADIFCDLLSGATIPGQAEATVDIRVELNTLLKLEDSPGHIPGYGPVIADIARKVVHRQTKSRWEYTVTDQGRPVATGTISRRPTTDMRRYLRARHQTCVFPGCRMPARQSDLDHTTAWNRQGPTHVDNLAPLCRHHHGLKDHGWTYQIAPDGVIIWTSPLDHQYTTGTDPP